jgi:hypothetical protein
MKLTTFGTPSITASTPTNTIVCTSFGFPGSTLTARAASIAACSFGAVGSVTIRYVPEQYPDLITALLASNSGDTIVLDTSQAILTGGYTTALDDITVRAGHDFTPVIDVSAPAYGLHITGDNWTFSGVTVRSNAGVESSMALAMEGTGHLFEDCVFEGCFSVFGNYPWSGSVQRCEFRNIRDGVTTTTGTVVFGGCLFYHCHGGFHVVTTGGSVDNCTMIECHAGSSGFLVADIRSNNFWKCTADVRMSNGTNTNQSNNAWLCTAGLALFGHSTGNNYSFDPVFVDSSEADFRVQATSPLVAIGEFETISGHNAEPFFDPPTIGAYEAFQVGSDDVVSETVIEVTLTQVVGDRALEVEAWSFTSDTGVIVDVTSVERLGDLTYRLTVYPGLSPGQTYLVHCEVGGYPSAPFEFTVVDGLAVATELKRYRYLGSIMNAVGEYLDELAGHGECELRLPIAAGDEVAHVDSTLKMPPNGAFWAGGVRFAYTAKTDAALIGLTEVLPRVEFISAGARVTADERAYIPAA